MRLRTVRDVMTKSVVSAYRNASFDEIVRVMIERDVSGMPVIDEGHHVVGVIAEPDLLARTRSTDDQRHRRWTSLLAGRPPQAVSLTTSSGELMKTPVITVSPEATIVRAARLLDSHRIKRLPVVDEDGRLVGIITLRDLLRVFTRSDAEIREEIFREVFARLLAVDPAAVSVRVSDGVVTLSGTLPYRGMIPIAVRLSAATDGVVGVIDELTYTDDAGAGDQ
jgi:CBS domain-containing protein